MAAIFYPKGSLWRRWDRHIHTPGTQKNDQFAVKGDSLQDRWRKYVEDINNYPGEVIAIGITDYVSVDNYFEFKQRLQAGDISKPIHAVFPNIELRVLPVTGSGVAINLHCIFNPDFDAQIKDRFLNQLKFDNGGPRLWSASDSDLIELGRLYKNNPNLDVVAAKREGVGQFVISIETIKEIFRKDQELKQNIIVVVSNNSRDGNSGITEHSELIEGIKFSSLDMTRQMIYKFCHAIFSGNDKDIKYFLGEGVDKPELVVDKCESLKPCYHGSDAHENPKILEPDLRRYCWIKADPTFNGLKQTIYEPKTRVRIQEDKPEQKKSYLVIDAVSFVTNQPNLFSADLIEMNDKMNAIVGGKSSGKSLLLYYIAKTIDPIQVNKKFAELGIKDDYGFETMPDFDFEVTWADQTHYTLKQTASEKTRQITYVPQMYINFLAERRGEEGLKTLIGSFLKEKESFRSYLQQQQPIHDGAKAGLSAAINQFFLLISSMSKKEEEIRGKGDKAAREANVLDKSAQLVALRAISGFTPEDEVKYEQLEVERRQHQERLVNLNNLLAFVTADYPAELQKLILQVSQTYDNVLKQVQAKFLTILSTAGSFQNSLDADKNEIVDKINQIRNAWKDKEAKIRRLIKLTTDKIENVTAESTPFLNRIANRDKLSSLTQEISNEELIIQQMIALNNELQQIKDLIQIEYDNIITNYEGLFNYYNNIAKEVNSKPKYAEVNKEKQITLRAYVTFDKIRFAATCTNFINKQNYFTNLFGSYFDSKNEYIFNGSTHIASFKEIFEKLLTNSQSGVRFNQGGTLQQVTNSLFDDYFSVNYELSQATENILKMSPGKKGLILLFLILHLSNADFPILIDQPEDNLDNRTVYNELKDFIKHKKIERQLIIVTHNANLVVPTDAENIIVANQEGQEYGKDYEKYKFEYTTGSLENTFRNDNASGILNKMGIKEHVCEILEGGEAAFIEREKRYSLPELAR